MIKKICFVILLVIFLVVNTVFPNEFKRIKNPTPNMEEKQYVQLKKVKTVDADLGNGEYLFKPFSLTADTKNIYVYDLLQAKIFKFDPDLKKVKKSFGRRGRGPGEFGGTGKGYPVFINMGRDGKLYANDIRMRKIIVFNQDGKYLKEFKNLVTNMRAPLVDSYGNLFTMSIKDKIIKIFNKKNTPLYTLENQQDCFNYLYHTPGSVYLKMMSRSLAGELLFNLTLDSTFLIYFTSSSKMILLKDKEVKKISIWPRKALVLYKNKLEELLSERKNSYINIFSKLIVDDENEQIFYLQFGRDKKNGINSLYQCNVEGKLLNIYCAKFEESMPFIRFEAKRRYKFYAIEGDRLTIYNIRR